jgi:hypothetical protein
MEKASSAWAVLVSEALEDTMPSVKHGTGVVTETSIMLEEHRAIHVGRRCWCPAWFA